jgi:hypothetical protein
VIDVRGPVWLPPAARCRESTFGLLILEGLLGCRTQVGDTAATELLTCGDIIRPWERWPDWGRNQVSLEWRVFHPARLAVLAPDVTALIGRRAQLTVNFSGRLLRRARSAQYLMALNHEKRVDARLLATLWYIADTCGRVTPQGVKIPFRITHDAFGEILGARRPSVTTAFHSLAARGLATREPGGTYTLHELDPGPGTLAGRHVGP